MPASVSAAATLSQAAVLSDHSGTSSSVSNDGMRATRTTSMTALTVKRRSNDLSCLLDRVAGTRTLRRRSPNGMPRSVVWLSLFSGT